MSQSPEPFFGGDAISPDTLECPDLNTISQTGRDHLIGESAKRAISPKGGTVRASLSDGAISSQDRHPEQRLSDVVRSAPKGGTQQLRRRGSARSASKCRTSDLVCVSLYHRPTVRNTFLSKLMSSVLSAPQERHFQSKLKKKGEKCAGHDQPS